MSTAFHLAILTLGIGLMVRMTTGIIYLYKVRHFTDSIGPQLAPERHLALLKYLVREYKSEGVLDILIPWREIVPVRAYRNIKKGNY